MSHHASMQQCCLRSLFFFTSAVLSSSDCFLRVLHQTRELPVSYSSIVVDVRCDGRRSSVIGVSCACLGSDVSEGRRSHYCKPGIPARLRSAQHTLYASLPPACSTMRTITVCVLVSGGQENMAVEISIAPSGLSTSITGYFRVIFNGTCKAHQQ